MQDPVQRHPTRAEQLDILASIIAEQCNARDAILDLGIGVGYVAGLILAKNPELEITGVDLKPESLEAADDYLADKCPKLRLIEADLNHLPNIDLAPQSFRAIYTALTFHDLPDDSKRMVIDQASRLLAEDGILLVYDRVRLTTPRTFSMQQSIWRRLHTIHGVAMRSADDFQTYEADLGSDNRPATLADYQSWFGESGFEFQLLHLHGNIALMGAAPASPSAV